MAEEIITKRLQVSGLTPAITPAELGAKLGSFGSVKALDGFGVLNAVGQPRKFGYVTIETTKAKLAKCMNLLSGVTWKGAKLRMGEAKPDFRERIAKEHEPPADDAPARKKRRLAKGVQGLHAVDMSLVTPENVQDRGGWRVTPLGRIVRPIRMRPEHPLPEPLPKAPIAKAKEKKDKKTGVVKEKRKRVKEPPTRARRRTIDPTKWDSQHLKGVFLDSGLAPTNVPIATQEVEDDSDSSDDSGEEEAARNEVEPINEEAEVEVELEASVPTPKPQAPTLSKSQIQDASSDLREESKTALGLLQSLFAGDEWGGAESVGSDVNMNDIGNITELDDDVTDEVETVPRQDTDVVMGHIQTPVTSDEEDETDEEESPKQPSKSQSQQTKLKDLFAPREEEAGFSLLGHLDLEDDLDLDEDILGLNLGPSEHAAPATLVATPTTPYTSHTRHQLLDFSTDATQPLFFPLPHEDRGAQRTRVRDLFDVAKEKGWDWRTFCRTETDEEIKKRWEETKGDLTRDWKRRHREAVKSRRRRGGLGGEDHD